MREAGRGWEYANGDGSRRNATESYKLTGRAAMPENSAGRSPATRSKVAARQIGRGQRHALRGVRADLPCRDLALGAGGALLRGPAAFRLAGALGGLRLRGFGCFRG